jgi:hypothetical protein
MFQSDGDKLRGVFPIGLGEVVLILKQLPAVWKFPQDRSQVSDVFGSVPEIRPLLIFSTPSRVAMYLTR